MTFLFALFLGLLLDFLDYVFTNKRHDNTH